MKYLKVLILLTTTVVLSCHSTTLKSNSTTSSTDNLTAQDHPRLVINNDELKNIKTLITSGSNEPLTLIHNAIMKKADEFLSKKPLTYKLDASGKRLLGVSRDAAQRISYCAYAYRYTGSKKYFDKAVETILTVCGFDNWNARHYLDVCEMVSGVAIGYDWLYRDLPQDVKSLVEEKVKAYAFDTMDSGHENIWNLMNNRNQVNLGGLTCAALGLYEVYPEFCNNLFRRVIESNKPVAEFIYNPAGVYPEGPGYWAYGTNYQVWLNMLLKENLGTNFGLDEIPGFRETAWYEMFATGSTGKPFNYCDCRDEAIAHYPVWYFADLLSEPGLVFTEIDYLKNNDYTKCQQRALIFIALKYAARINPADFSPSSRRLFAGDGATPVALARSGWGRNDHWAAIKGGKAESSHSHMDAGEFLYDAYGVRWSKDVWSYGYDKVEKPLIKLGGNYWSYTQDSMRWQVSRVNCRWHSCLIIDDEDLLVDGFASLVESYDKNGRVGATFNLTPLYKKISKVHRSVSICNDEFLEVADEIITEGKARTVRFNLVGDGEPTIVSDGIILSKDNVQVKLSTSTPGAKYRIWSTDPTEFNDFPFEEPAPDTYICGFTVTLPKNSSTKIITTIKKI